MEANDCRAGFDRRRGQKFPDSKARSYGRLRVFLLPDGLAMPIIRGILPLLFGAIALTPVLWAHGYAAETPPTVRVVFNTAPNPPIVYGTGTTIDPDKPSLIVELLRMVSARTGIPMEFQRFPWQRGLYMVEYGQADAIFASSFSPERLRYGVYPMKDGQPDTRRAIHTMAYALFVRRDSTIGWDGHSITGLKAPVGATPAFAIVDELKAMGVPLDLEVTPESNLRKLTLGRIDGYAELETLAEAAIKANPAAFGQIVKLSPPLRTRPYYLMFSRSFYEIHRDVAEQVWNTIAEVTATNEYKALVEGKYAD